ncbi:MAG: tetratricopeptide repeat protein [Phycisphaera sp.]|nr:MAG: tetratricopeptide repeat protein [Phycisphaera sp.]
MTPRDEARLALDRLPSRFPAYEPQEPPRKGLGLGTCAVGLLSIGLVVALAVFWQGAKPPPSSAAAASMGSAVKSADITAALEQAQTYMADGEPAMALAVLEPMVARADRDRDVRVALAGAYLAVDDDQAAYDQFSQAITLGNTDPQLHFAAGTLASRLRRQTEAIAHLRLAHEADPSNPQYALFLGQAELEAGNYAPATAALARARHASPDDPRIWGMLAEIALRENKSEMALQHAGRARHHDPENDAWKIIQARALNRMGDASKAVVVIGSLSDKAMRTKPVLRLAGECYGMLKQPIEAAALYRAASDARPKDPELAFEAAAWLDRASDRPTALAYARRAKEAGHAGAAQLIERLSDQREFKSKPR